MFDPKRFLTKDEHEDIQHILTNIQFTKVVTSYGFPALLQSIVDTSNISKSRLSVLLNYKGRASVTKIISGKTTVCSTTIYYLSKLFTLDDTTTRTLYDLCVIQGQGTGYRA